VFQRLFQDVIKDAVARKPTQEFVEELQTGRRRSNVKTREELLDSISKFPEGLRDIALSTAERIERDTWEAQLKATQDPDEGVAVLTAEEMQRANETKKAQAADLDRLKSMMENAESDLVLWKIIEEELFNRVDALKLDEVVKQHNESSSKKSSKRKSPPVQAKNEIMPPAMIKDITTIGAFYPAGLLAALAVFRERFPTSTLPLSILPQIKRLGRGSYALGTSSSLYHELLQITWALTGDFPQVNNILQEMDVAGFDFTDETFAIIRRIQKQWEQRIRKPRTRLESAVNRMGMIGEGFDKMIAWRSIIEERLEAEALREANQKIGDHVV
jgi:hypothetical protein